MDAKFVYVMENKYQNDNVILDRLNNGGLTGLIDQPQIQYQLDTIDAIFVSSISAVVSPNKIEATIQVTLSAEFASLYPTNAEKDVMLMGFFQGIISTGLSCVNVIETITYI